MISRALNSANFDIVELDTNVLTPQIHLGVQAQTVGRYAGTVTNPDGTSKQFFLVVVAQPAEMSVAIDVSATWVAPPTFTVAVQGYVRVSVLSGSGGQTIRIANSGGTLLDNTALQQGQIVVLGVLRPGTHILSDSAGGGTCQVTVSYPAPPLVQGAVTVNINPKTPGSAQTVMSPSSISLSPTQLIAVYVQNGTRLITKLQSTTDRVKGVLVTTPVA